MKSICMCFQVHQPYHPGWYWPGEGHTDQLDLNLYFDLQKNFNSFTRLCQESFLPTFQTLLKTIDKYDSKYAVNVSGTLLKQCEWDPGMIVSLKELANTGNMEFLCSPYYNSISSLIEHTDYFRQHILLHKRTIRELFGYRATAFINSDLIYTPQIPSHIKDMGFQSLITEGAENLLQGRNPAGIFKTDDLAILARHIQLSEDIEKRYPLTTWIDYPLVPEKFTSWIRNMEGEVVLLYIDCAPFGGHVNSGADIFQFLERLPADLEKNHIDMITPSEAVGLYNELELPSFTRESVARYGMFNVLGNHIQNLYFHELLEIGQYLEDIQNPLFGEIFGFLQQVDILSSMNSLNEQISFEIAMNNFSILSDFKRRIIMEGK